MKPVPYSPKPTDLFAPRTSTTVFYPGIEPAEPLLCAELSRLVYRAFELDHHELIRLREELAWAGCELLFHFDREGTQALLLRRHDSLYLVFRGTEVRISDGRLDIRNVWTDLIFWHRPWGKRSQFPELWQSIVGTGAARVHHGFAEALEVVWRDIELALRDLSPGRIVLTGHSLGAALATLAATRLPAGFTATVYTFGSPRVGNAAFRKMLVDVPVYRYVNCCDVVCTVPPAFVLGYVHVGEECYLAHDGHYLPGITPKQIRRDQRAGKWAYFFQYGWMFFRNLAWRELADHAPINYVHTLWAHFEPD